LSYSIIGIVNLGLGRIGSNLISDIGEKTPQAIAVNAVWEYVRDEVLQAKDWRFAKTRAALTVSVTIPLYGYRFAYPLPADFLRLCKQKFPQFKGMNPVAYPPGYWYEGIDLIGYPRYFNFDPPVYPPGSPYVIESLPDTPFTLCLFTDYDNTSNDLFINYIRREVNPIRYTPTFISALAYKLAAEVAIKITQNEKKTLAMTQLYELTLKSAAAHVESLDWIDEEAGSTEWEDAGR
jgi:hypothetical protein